jgi:anti-sigma factor RsiW
MSLPKDDLLSAFHDGEATSAERVVVEQRLSASAEARQELAKIQQVSSLLKDLPRESLPSEFPQQVLKAVEREMLIPSGRSPDGDAKWTQKARSWWTQQSSSRRWACGAGTVLTSAAGLFLLVRALDGEPSTAPQSPLQIAATSSREGTSADDYRNSGAMPAGVATETAVPSDHLESRMSNRVDRALGSNSVVFDAPASTTASNTNRDGVLARSGGLYFDQSTLREAEIGDVVDALQTNGDQVAVVRLTVVDRQKGRKHLQVLLAKNHIPQSDAGEAAKTFSDARSERESADLAKRNSGQGAATEQMLAVYVESDSQQLAATLRQLRESQIVQSLEVEQPILLAQLDAVGEGHERLNENLSQTNKSARDAAEKPSDTPRARKTEENKAKKSDEESTPDAQRRAALKPESAEKKAEAVGDKQPAVVVKGRPTADPTADPAAPGTKADVAQSANRKQMVSRQLALQLPADAVPAGAAGAKAPAQARGQNLTRGLTRAKDAAEPQAESRPMQVLFVVVDQAQAGKSLQRNAAPKASTPAATPAEPAQQKTPEQDGAA